MLTGKTRVSHELPSGLSSGHELVSESTTHGKYDVFKQKHAHTLAVCCSVEENVTKVRKEPSAVSPGAGHGSAFASRVR